MKVDVAVIGGGFSGLSCALHILERMPGAQVIVLEADHVGAGASGRNTGILGPGVGQSFPAVVRRFGLYTLVPHDFFIEAVYQRGRETGRSLLPARRTVHPVKLAAGLSTSVTTRGGVIFEDACVKRIDSSHGSAVLHMERGGQVSANTVIIATAAYTARLGFFRGRVWPVHLQVMATEPLAKDTLAQLGWNGRQPVVDSRRLFNYFRLTSDDRIVFGGGIPRFNWCESTQPINDPAAFHHLARALAATFAVKPRLRIARAWSGLIDLTLDGLPAIERYPGHEQILHVVGWCGHGIALSLAAGRWIATILCDRARPADLPWFRRDLPLLAGAPVRWLCFRAATHFMTVLDRVS
jgi:gamma-glutamylputrescine oxidase